MMILHHLALGSLCLGQLAQASLFQNFFGIKGFREMMHHRQQHINKIQDATLAVGDIEPTLLYPAHNISVPIDHFHNDSMYEPHTNDTFELRYYFDRSNYKEGFGPVIVLQGGENSADSRLDYLQKGILSQLTKATNGLGVVLEHRFYGTSVPNHNFATDNLRFLTTQQALADMAYFAQNVVFEGLEHLNLTSPNTAYFAYGSSYAGAAVALLRKIYPDVYFGAIASSAVTEAVYDYYEFWDAPRTYGPTDCIYATTRFTQVIDNLLLGKVDPSPDLPQRLKNVFGLGNVTHDADFARVVSNGVIYYAINNWDPEESNPEFGFYCNNVTSPTLLYPNLESRRTEVQYLMNSAGYGDERETPFTNQILNYIGYVGVSMAEDCSEYPIDCYSNYNRTFHEQSDITAYWRAWTYQTCTEWGFFLTGTVVDQDTFPLISQVINLDYLTNVCREAFNISTPPDVDRINRYGDVNFSYPRLAFVDGEKDVWRQATPHSDGVPYRNSTIAEPFILIPGAYHHADENGVFPNETRPGFPPTEIVSAQQLEVAAVRGWFKLWGDEKVQKDHCGNVLPFQHCPDIQY